VTREQMIDEAVRRKFQKLMDFHLIFWDAGQPIEMTEAGLRVVREEYRQIGVQQKDMG
jgi:uncharacterized protein YjhX (UPF0386 family)